MRHPVKCSAVETLIPWDVNGTLDQDDMMQVDGHIQDCEHCRCAIETEMKFSRNYARFTDPDTAHADQTEAALNDLLTALPAQPVNTGNRMRTASFVTAAVAVIALGLFALLDNRDTRVEYRTLTVPAEQTQSVVLQLVFQTGTREAEIRQIVSASAASITSGPTPQGVYRIRLTNNLQQPEIDILVTQLREHPAVLMAEAELR